MTPLRLWAVVRRAWCWLAYHLFVRLPHYVTDTRAGLWLLAFAGEHAHRPLTPEPTP